MLSLVLSVAQRSRRAFALTSALRLRPCRPSLRTGVLLLCSLAACSSPEPAVIDGSSPEAFSRTVEAARRDLPVADRLDFDRALASVRTRRFGADDPEALARLSFDKMTAAEVVADYRARQR